MKQPYPNRWVSNTTLSNENRGYCQMNDKKLQTDQQVEDFQKLQKSFDRIYTINNLLERKYQLIEAAKQFNDISIDQGNCS